MQEGGRLERSNTNGAVIGRRFYDVGTSISDGQFCVNEGPF